MKAAAALSLKVEVREVHGARLLIGDFLVYHGNRATRTRAQPTRHTLRTQHCETRSSHVTNLLPSSTVFWRILLFSRILFEIPAMHATIDTLPLWRPSPTEPGT